MEDWILVIRVGQINRELLSLLPTLLTCGTPKIVPEETNSPVVCWKLLAKCKVLRKRSLSTFFYFHLWFKVSKTNCCFYGYFMTLFHPLRLFIFMCSIVKWKNDKAMANEEEAIVGLCHVADRREATYDSRWCRIFRSPVQDWGWRKDPNQFHVLPAIIDVTGWLRVATGGRKWHTRCSTVL